MEDVLSEVRKIEAETLPTKLWPYQEEAVKRMAGIGRGMEVGGKAFFRMGTALTTSPQHMHFALAGKPRDDA